ncbi:arginine--tRNA ligase [Thermodesulfobacteriota bacterium]
MKDKVREAIHNALSELSIESDLEKITLDHPKNDEHGDLATNVAMVYSKQAKKKPRDFAVEIVDAIKKGSDIFSDIQIAGPGFINFFLNEQYWLDVVRDVNVSAGCFGSQALNNKKVLIEFVSANPTGPLHIGHGRGAAVGDTLARIMKFAGYTVDTEYYINDVGNQLFILGSSVYARYCELFGKDVEFKENFYQGDYIKDIAARIKDKDGEKYIEMDEGAAISELGSMAGNEILDGIRDDLKDFSVEFDRWYSERTLVDSGKRDQAIADLKERGIIYEAEGAWWFKTTDFGDEKDRVVIKADGAMTYFASDIAYHKEKYERGYDEIVDIWGADHHGYVARITAVIEAMGHDKKSFTALLIQLVHLLRDGEKVSMSTRAGKFDTLKEVVDDVGKDAARYFFMMRKADSHLNFDLELAKKQSSENPVYYVQYAHARICSIIKNAKEKGASIPESIADATWALDSKEEINIIKQLWVMPEVIKNSAEEKEPHKVAFYAYELASLFHTFYNKHRVLVEDEKISQSRLFLVQAIRHAIKNCLRILGITAPETM